MDQGKFAIPSDASLRASAVRAKHIRPTLKLHGAWCFGWVLDLWILDEPTKHDASCVIEIVALCLERVYEKSLELGQPMPGTLLLFSDNTVREAKNSVMIGYLNNLVSKYKMRLTGLLCLRKSHSHDRIDQLWGLLARRISCCDQLLSPDSVIEIVKHELNRKGLKSWIGLNTEIRVNKINAVRSWRQHFTPQKVSLSGGLLEDSTANHCFLCIARRGRTSPPQKKTNMFHPANISRGSVLTITLGLPSILFAQICRTASPQTSMLEPAQPQPVAMMLSCWWSSGSGPTTYLSSHCWPLLVGVLAWLIRWFQQPSSWSWNHIHV